LNQKHILLWKEEIPETVITAEIIETEIEAVAVMVAASRSTSEAFQEISVRMKSDNTSDHLVISKA